MYVTSIIFQTHKTKYSLNFTEFPFKIGTAFLFIFHNDRSYHIFHDVVHYPTIANMSPLSVNNTLSSLARMVLQVFLLLN